MFDIGGVLVRWDDEVAFRRVARRYHLPPAPTARRLRALRGSLQAGRISIRQFWQRFARESGVPVPRDWRTWWSDEMAHRARLRPSLVRLAERLRARGNRTAVFSNTDATHWAVFRSRGWLRAFDRGFPSFRLRWIKPSPAAFRAVERALGPQSRPIVFVDDRRPNIETARRRGWDAIWFRSIPELRRALAARGLLGPMPSRRGASS